MSSSSSMSKCAACGKGGDNLKVCTSCEQVSYCNAKCRNAHRSKHKKECKQYAAKIRDENAAIRAEVDAISEKLCSIVISDEELFAEPPPKEDCDICFLPMSYTQSGGFSTVYQMCCGKTICYGCVKAAKEEVRKGKMKDCCPFCRMPSTDDEGIQRVKKRTELNDANAFHWLAGLYKLGLCGPQDHRKVFELYSRGAELGSVSSHQSLATAYKTGVGVVKDEEKAKNHLMLAAIKGSEVARYALGNIESKSGNIDRAMKHYMIAARSGYDNALEEVGEGYKAGCVTKDEYASTLRAHRASQDEMKSEQRALAGVLTY